MKENELKSAEISECGLYRFKLSRNWNLKQPNVLFIMLNPSTADASVDDATIRRCIGYCKKWNYGGLLVGNLSPFRATNPIQMQKHQTLPAIIERNTKAIIEMASQQTQIIVCAWGNNATTELKRNLYDVFLKVDKPYFCLGTTKSGEPKHPLYLPLNAELERFDMFKATNAKYEHLQK
jgi:hypothetical protein